MGSLVSVLLILSIRVLKTSPINVSKTLASFESWNGLSKIFFVSIAGTASIGIRANRSANRGYMLKTQLPRWELKSRENPEMRESFLYLLTHPQANPLGL